MLAGSKTQPILIKKVHCSLHNEPGLRSDCRSVLSQTPQQRDAYLSGESVQKHNAISGMKTLWCTLCNFRNALCDMTQANENYLDHAAGIGFVVMRHRRAAAAEADAACRAESVILARDSQVDGEKIANPIGNTLLHPKSWTKMRIQNQEKPWFLETSPRRRTWK